MFLITKHPLILGLILIIQTVLISLFIGLISQTFWFSYILFLIIIGGILILFIYTISFIFNKIFVQKFNIKTYLIIIIIFILLLFINKSIFLNNFELNLNINNHSIQESIYNLIKLYNFPINLLNLIIINYLFFLLIVVVKITNFFYGPIRIKF